MHPLRRLASEKMHGLVKVQNTNLLKDIMHIPIYREMMTEIMTWSSTDASYEIKYILVDGEPWFKGKEVATALGYTNTTQALLKNVDDGDKKKLDALNNQPDGGEKNVRGNGKNAIYINQRGLKSLTLRSEKPVAAELARTMGITVETKYLRKEIEIVSFIQEFLTTLMIPFEFQKTVGAYRVDMYLPHQNLAIEIDEFGHKHRDPAHEHQREQSIKQALQCTFLRINPDEENFRMAHCLGQLTKYIFMHS